MPDYFVQVTLPWITNLPGEETVATFTVHQELGIVSVENADFIGDKVKDFFTEVPPDTTFSDGLFSPNTTVAQWMSPLHSTDDDACRIDVYDLTGHLDGDNMGAPLNVEMFTIEATGDDGLPPTVALNVRIDGVGRAQAAVEVGNTRPKQRLTGFLELGPLAVATVDQSAVGLGRPSLIFRKTVLSALNALYNEFQAHAPAMVPAVWSRVGQSVSAGVEAINMDNSFDVVGSRKDTPSVNTRLLGPWA